MQRLAIIGGTGLTSLDGLTITHKEMVRTPYGDPSGPLTYGQFSGHEVVFLARHGYGHTIPPHMVNYRANLWAMAYAKVSHVIAVAAVGGISEALEPGMLVIPDQLIDYTWGRCHTFFEQDLKYTTHVDCTTPYCEKLRKVFCDVARTQDIAIVDGGVYGVMQGPRLETAAEINRLERDGCTVVGMTAMPEAVLARELELCYAAVNVVANKAAGRGKGKITVNDIRNTLNAAMESVCSLVEASIGELANCKDITG